MSVMPALITKTELNLFSRRVVLRRTVVVLLMDGLGESRDPPARWQAGSADVDAGLANERNIFFSVY